MPIKSIVRSESAGVFFGVVENHDTANGTVEMADARRIWYWSGAASLSQLAVEGTKRPEDCKFPVAVRRMVIAKVIEVIPCTSQAQRNLEEVPIWSA